MTLRSEARIRLADPAETLAHLCRHFAEEEIDAQWTGERGELRFPFGAGTLESRRQLLLVTAEAGDLDDLIRLKNVLASHIEELAEEGVDVIWTGDGVEETVLPNLRVMRVARASTVTPLVRRVTLRGDNLRRFDSDRIHVKLLVPPANGLAPEWPTLGRNGRPAWPEAERRPVMRTYTIRRLDVAAGELDIDFVLHGDEGVASRWAAHAVPGDVVGLLGPGGSQLREADWHLLGGDATAIPAIARMLDRLPADARAVVRIEVESAAEEQPLSTRAALDLRYVLATPDRPGAALEAAIRAVPLPTDGSPFAYIGAEAGVARRLRAHLRDACGLDRKRCLSVAYWRLGKSEDEADGDE